MFAENTLVNDENNEETVIAQEAAQDGLAETLSDLRNVENPIDDDIGGADFPDIDVRILRESISFTSLEFIFNVIIFFNLST